VTSRIFASNFTQLSSRCFSFDHRPSTIGHRSHQPRGRRNRLRKSIIAISKINHSALMAGPRLFAQRPLSMADNEILKERRFGGLTTKENRVARPPTAPVATTAAMAITPPTAPRHVKTPAEKFAELSPPERLKERAKAAGYVVAQCIAAIVFLLTGAEVFLHTAAQSYIHFDLDPTRAQDIFFGLCGYYGIPLFVGGRHPQRSGQ
jgi:hypothetical protein